MTNDSFVHVYSRISAACLATVLATCLVCPWAHAESQLRIVASAASEGDLGFELTIACDPSTESCPSYAFFPEANHLIDNCNRYALLTQVDATRYDLKVLVILEDADNLSETAPGQYRADVDPPYAMRCEALAEE